MSVEQSFIRKITGVLLHYRFKGGDVHQFCCPYCQPHGTDKTGKKISPSKAKGYFYKKRIQSTSIATNVGMESNSTTSSRITSKKNSSLTSRSESKEELRARGITVQLLQMPLKALVERYLRNQFSGERKPTKSRTQQMRRRRHHHLKKTRVVATHPKSRNSHL